MEPSVTSGATMIMLGLVALPIYFVPTIVAFFREHRNLWAIFMLNLFLGWTFAFWALALVWAVIKVPVVRLVDAPETQTPRPVLEDTSTGANR